MFNINLKVLGYIVISSTQQISYIISEKQKRFITVFLRDKIVHYLKLVILNAENIELQWILHPLGIHIWKN